MDENIFYCEIYIFRIELDVTIFRRNQARTYRIYSNKRRGAYLIFRATSAALIRGQRLFKHCTRQIYFFYIFIPMDRY